MSTLDRIRKPTSPQDPLGEPLMLLKPGAEAPPIFMAPGICDVATGLSQLASQMRTSHCIYGFQPRGVYDSQEPFKSIDDIAEYHLNAIRQLQPRGPYFLIGYSLGGIVMLEIARRLRANAEKIGLLVMLDSYLERHHLAMTQHARLLVQLAKRRIRLALETAQNRSASSAPELPPVMVRLTESQEYAWRNYRPQFYDGAVKFLRAATISFFPADPNLVWSRWFREIKVDTVPGNHVELLTIHAKAVAAVLSEYLNVAL